MNAFWHAMGLITAVAAMAAGCAHPWSARLTLPASYTVVRDQLVIRSDFPLPANHRLLTELTAVRNDLRQRLGVPASDEPIQVYLFDNAEQFRAFMLLHHPDLPDRRAFFLETDTRLQIYAQWGDRIAEDLRHEVTHGYLHSTMPGLPLWLDEGMAEYYEVPRASRGLHRADLEFLLTAIQHRRWQPDLARLERLQPIHEMTQEEYCEAWAWVHFLLETRQEHRSMLREYLDDLRRLGTAEPLGVRLRQLVPEPEQVLVAYVESLAAHLPK
jgi:hypothetical protein